MAIIKSTFGAGGAGIGTIGRSGASPDLVTILRDMADDFATLRTWGNTLATKLNADAGVTDTDYAQIATLKTSKGA